MLYKFKTHHGVSIRLTGDAYAAYRLSRDFTGPRTPEERAKLECRINKGTLTFTDRQRYFTATYRPEAYQGTVDPLLRATDMFCGTNELMDALSALYGVTQVDETFSVPFTSSDPDTYLREMRAGFGPQYTLIMALARNLPTDSPGYVDWCIAHRLRMAENAAARAA